MQSFWPPQYAVDPTRRGSLFAPVYLGLATLPRDRFAFARGPGSVTTHPLTIVGDGLWLNADGDGLAVTAIDGDGTARAQGRLCEERRDGVYRRVRWSAGPPPRGAHRMQIHLGAADRLFSVATLDTAGSAVTETG